MDINKILKKVDHTMLSPMSTAEDIIALCEDAKKYNTASVCVPPSMVSLAANHFNNVCTVIGFPNGYNTTSTKIFEAEDAVKNGANEIDMVINLGWAKMGCYNLIQDEICAIKQKLVDLGAVYKRKIILKVIIESCLWNNDEIISLCKVVTNAGADYIKTSTGFSTGGATIEVVKLMRENVGEEVKVKAAGGISSIEDAEKMVKVGADRLGTSRIVKIVKNQEKK